MNNRLLIAAFVSICFLSGSCKISSGQGSRYDFSSLDSVIQGWVDKGYYPGASICVVKNDTVIFQKNYRDNTPDTKVYVASAGKWVAAAVIGVVVDRFGPDIHIMADGPDHFKTTARVAVSPQFISWVFGFGSEVQVLSPPGVVQAFQQELAAVQTLYKKGQ